MKYITTIIILLSCIAITFGQGTTNQPPSNADKKPTAHVKPTKENTANGGGTKPIAKALSNNANNMLIYEESNEAYYSIKENKGVFTTLTLPDTLFIFLPNAKDPSNYSIQIDTGKNKTTLSFNCKGKDTSCVQLSNNLNYGGIIKLVFRDGNLISPTYKKIYGKAPYLFKIIDSSASQKVSKPKTLCDSFSYWKNPIIKQLNNSNLLQLKSDLSYLNSDCQVTKKTNGDCSELWIRNPYLEERFSTLCGGPENEFAETSDYRLIYDTRKNGPGQFTLLKYVHSKEGYDYYKVIRSGGRKKFILDANSHMEVTVIGNKDSNYVVNDSATHLFMDGESSFENALQPSKPSNSQATDTTNSRKSPPTKTTHTLVGAVTNFNDEGLVKAVNKYDFRWETEPKKTFSDSLHAGLTGPYPIFKQNIDSIKSATFIHLPKSFNRTGLIDSLVIGIRNYNAKGIKKTEVPKLEKKIDTLLIQFNEAYNKADSNKHEKDESKSIANSTIIRNNLLAIDEALRRLIQWHNYENSFGNIDFLDDQFTCCFNKLKNNIETTLGISVFTDAKSFTGSLIEYVKRNMDSTQYDGSFCDIINSIQTNYNATLNIVDLNRIQGTFIQIPDADNINLNIKTVKGKTSLYQESFDIKGGFKIDFSSGFFVSGITSPTYTVVQHKYNYAVVRDSISPSGNVTPIYTNHIRDTSGNLIHTKKTPMNFGTGFFAHFYSRSGHALDWGGTVGVSINNTAQPQFMLGGSLMLKAGSNRIAFIAGATVGQENILLPADYQYRYSKSTPTDNTLLLNNQVPDFFSGSTPDLVNVWTISWFGGITFNFASISK